MTVQVKSEEDVQAVEAATELENVQFHHADFDEALEEANEGGEEQAAQPFTRAGEKVGRNDPCPCGSGKKYKQCHGKLS